MRLKSSLILVVLFIMGYGCASSVSPINRKVQGEEMVEEDRPSLSKVQIFWGHAKKVWTVLPREIIQSSQRNFYCGDLEVPHQVMEKNFIAFVSVSHKDPLPFICSLHVTRDGEMVSYPLFEIVPKYYAFDKEYLDVAKQHVELSSKNLKRWKGEMALQRKIYSESVDEPHFNTGFSLPLESVITSPFGLRRIFNNKRESRHLGTDFRARRGTSIPVSNRGRVVFVGDLFFNGKTVIVDHGMNIFTMYCHLSQIATEQGKIVSKGSIIGLAGATGRVTGPHLHWGLKVDGNWVKGRAFVNEQI